MLTRSKTSCLPRAGSRPPQTENSQPAGPGRATLPAKPYLWPEPQISRVRSSRCPLTGVWIKKLVQLYSGILLSHKKEQIWFSWTEMDEPRACHTEWRKSEREKQILYINVYVWNLEKWYRWTYLQGSNGDADIEKRHVDTVWEREGEMNLENSMETYTLPYIK